MVIFKYNNCLCTLHPWKPHWGFTLKQVIALYRLFRTQVKKLNVLFLVPSVQSMRKIYAEIKIYQILKNSIIFFDKIFCFILRV